MRRRRWGTSWNEKSYNGFTPQLAEGYGIPIYDLKQLGVVMVIMITIIGGTGVLTVRHQGESLR